MATNDSSPSSPSPVLGDDDVTALNSLRALLENAVSRSLQADSPHAHLADANGYVKLADLIEIPGVRAVSDDEAAIAKALADSSIVEVSPDNLVRLLAKRAARTTIILREIDADVTQEEISALIDAKLVVSARPDVHQTWFVQLATEADARQAVLDLANKQLRGKPVKARVKSENLSKLAVPWVPSSTASPGAARPANAVAAATAANAAAANAAPFAFRPPFTPYYPGAAPFVPAAAAAAAAASSPSAGAAAAIPGAIPGAAATLAPNSTSPRWKSPRASPKADKQRLPRGPRPPRETPVAAPPPPEFRPADFPTLPTTNGHQTSAPETPPLALVSPPEVASPNGGSSNDAAQQPPRRRGWEQPGIAAVKRKEDPVAAPAAQPPAVDKSEDNGAPEKPASPAPAPPPVASAAPAAATAAPVATLQPSAPAPPVWGAKSFAQVIKESRSASDAAAPAAQSNASAIASNDWRKDAATWRQKDQSAASATPVTTATAVAAAAVTTAGPRKTKE